MDPEQITHLCYVFTWFEAVSDLKVNLSKLELVPMREVHNLGGKGGGIFWVVIGDPSHEVLGPSFGGGFK